MRARALRTVSAERSTATSACNPLIAGQGERHAGSSAPAGTSGT
jgi:hypothetical protein